MLARALAGARRICGWVVTPPVTDQVVTLDGNGKRTVRLPTMCLTAITACTENGVALDPAVDLIWSREGFVQKTSGRRWCDGLATLRFTINHGFDEVDAEDWRGAVLAAVDLAAQNVGPTMQEYSVDDVLRKWFKVAPFAFDAAVLGNYQLTGVG